MPNFDRFQLIAVNVHRNNECYCSVDGVLYSKNREKLIFYPGKRRKKEFIILKETKQLLDFDIDDYDLQVKKETGFLLNVLDGVCSIYSSFFDLEAIYVDKNNAYYCSIDGVLFSKTGRYLFIIQQIKNKNHL